ncbi:DUF748 domain-containing protein [Comamonas sp.]|uniref:DUF748 domain-containing protein n=1 Tax=Comamonas sp. TaxID=34028 RepID=UPI003D0D5DC6
MSETQETNKKRVVAMRWLRRLGWCLLALLLLWALSWLLLPWLLRTQSEKLGTEKLGRAVHIGAVEFKPWSLELTVRDLQIAGPQADSAAMLAVERIYVDADIQSVFRLAPVLDAIQVDKPVLRIAQTAPGKFDFDDILQKLRSPEPKADDGKTAHFALYNIELKDGQVALRDDTVGQTHELQGLQLGIPFLSNLESKREIKVLPQLAFVLNGSQFASHAEATPFADDRKAEAKFAIKDLDLQPYLAYIPASLPVKLVAGVLNADLALAFEQREKTQVRLSGEVHASAVQLHDAANSELLGWERLDVQLADVQPLLGQVHIAQLALDGAQLSLKRGKNGQLSLLDAQGQALPRRAEDAPQAAKSTETAAAADKAEPATSVASADGASPEAKDDKADKADNADSQAVAAEAGASAGKASSGQPAWSVRVDALKLSRLKGVWVDESVPLPARVQLDDFSMEAQQIAWPFKQPFSFEGSSGLSGAQGVPSTGRLVFSGKATDQMAEVDVTTTGLPLQLGASYLTGVIEPGLLGTIDSEMHLSRQGTALKLTLAQMRVSDVALQCNSKANCAPPHGPAIGLKGKNNLLELRQLLVKDAVLDTEAQQVKLGSVQLVEPVLGVSRAKDGRMMFEDWLVASQARQSEAKAPAKPATSSKAAASKPWDVQLDVIAIKGAQLAFQDESTARKVAFRLTGWDLELRDYAPLAAKAKPSPLKLSGRIGSGRAEPGRIAYDGSLGLAPVSAVGRLNVSQLPVHAFEPYAAALLPVRLMRADANFRGTVDYAQSDKGPVLHVKGDAGLDDVRVRPLVAAAAPASGDDASDDDGNGASETGRKAAAPVANRGTGTLGIGLMGAGDDLLNWKLLSLRALAVDMVPGQRMKVQVGETALTDFYARLVVQENGKLNLQDLGGSSAAGAGNAAAPSEGVVVEASGGAAVSPPASPASPEPATGPIIDMGPITLAGGTVKFSDQFVRPNYSADLSELAGRMGAFSSEPTAGQLQLAELELRGKAEGTASLEITGKLNPLVKPLALNIHGKVRDLELSPLTPYSIKYAGHGIERGKMSVDVQYDVTPEGMLTASNKLVLNQLTFGDAVQGAPASLPVKLAVALLADRNGVIDLDLPISGSLNDPQFRLAPIIFKVIGNLIMKAVTSPFALLSGAFGGGSEASHVPFAPGSAVLDADSKQSLDKVAKALEDRPALQLTVAGQADLEREKDGWRKARIDDLVLAQKRRSAVRAGGKPEDVQAVSAAEYPALLKEVYKRADIQKPRNLVGMASDIPVAEMETLLLTSISVPDNAMRELALARGVTVRDYLASKGVKLERLFLGNAKTEGFGEDKDWTPHAELSLAPR